MGSQRGGGGGGGGGRWLRDVTGSYLATWALPGAALALASLLLLRLP